MHKDLLTQGAQGAGGSQVLKEHKDPKVLVLNEGHLMVDTQDAQGATGAQGAQGHKVLVVQEDQQVHKVLQCAQGASRCTGSSARVHTGAQDLRCSQVLKVQQWIKWSGKMLDGLIGATGAQVLRCSY